MDLTCNPPARRLDELFHDPNKGSKVEARFKETEAELAVAKERWESISSSIHAEVRAPSCLACRVAAQVAQ